MTTMKSAGFSCLLEDAAKRRVGPGGTEILPKPQYDACHFRDAVEEAKRVAAESGIGSIEAAQRDLETALAARQQFWADTCREITRMRLASRHVHVLHQKYGCRFEAPSCKQVQHILDALDSAMPLWDRHHPELFYRTLELNFPELRHYNFTTRYWRRA
jgi:hypothetical protein